MNPRPQPFVVRTAATLHAMSLRCCPRSFRERFAIELRQTFAASCRDAHRRGGSFAVACTVLAACSSALATAWRLHMNASPSLRRTLLVLPVALGLAALTGWIDQHASDVQLPALLLFGGAFVCSLLQPRTAWLWWLIAGASIPVAATIASWCGHRAPFESDQGSWWIAFVPALVGAATGAGIRKSVPAVKPPAAA